MAWAWDCRSAVRSSRRMVDACWPRPTYPGGPDRKSTRLNSSHSQISYAVFCLKKKNKHHGQPSAPAPINSVKSTVISLPLFHPSPSPLILTPPHYLPIPHTLHIFTQLQQATHR